MREGVESPSRILRTKSWHAICPQLVTKILLPLSLFDRAAGFLRPDRRICEPARADRSRPAVAPRFVALNASRPRLDRIEHAGMLDGSGREPKEDATSRSTSGNPYNVREAVVGSPIKKPGNKRIKMRDPAHVRILLRADSGFAREELMTWCEANGVSGRL